MSDQDLLRQRILAAIALAGLGGAVLPGCFDEHPPVTDAAVDTAAPTDTSKPTDTGAPVDSTATPDAGISSDLGPPPDTSEPGDAAPPTDAGTPIDNGAPVDVVAPTDQGAPLDAGAPDVTEAPLPTSCNGMGSFSRRCYTPEGSITAARNPPTGPLPPGVDAGGPRDLPDGAVLPNGCAAPRWVASGCCNPAVAVAREGDQCCYVWCDLACCGRPLRVDGVARTAEAVSRTDWGASEGARTDTLDPVTRAALVHAWRADALLEHASVAAFGRLTLELMAHGAPADLVRDAQRAGLDEVAHAEGCFALVTRLKGEPVGPGPLDLTGMVLLRDLAVCAVDAAREGCVGETVSALLAQRQAERASDPAVRALLTKIAEDEARHAELSWRVVAWAMRKGGARVRDAVSAALRERVSSVVGLPRPDGRPEGVDRAQWERFGRLEATERDTALDAIRREVLVPCTVALLGTRGETPAASVRTV